MRRFTSFPNHSDRDRMYMSLMFSDLARVVYRTPSKRAKFADASAGAMT